MERVRMVSILVDEENVLESQQGLQEVPAQEQVGMSPMAQTWVIRVVIHGIRTLRIAEDPVLCFSSCGLLSWERNKPLVSCWP